MTDVCVLPASVRRTAFVPSWLSRHPMLISAFLLKPKVRVSPKNPRVGSVGHLGYFDVWTTGLSKKPKVVETSEPARHSQSCKHVLLLVGVYACYQSDSLPERLSLARILAALAEALPLYFLTKTAHTLPNVTCYIYRISCMLRRGLDGRVVISFSLWIIFFLSYVGICQSI